MDLKSMIGSILRLIETTCLLEGQAECLELNCQILVHCIKPLRPFLQEVEESELLLSSIAISWFSDLQHALIDAKEILESLGPNSSRFYAVLLSSQYVIRFQEISQRMLTCLRKLLVESLPLSEGTGRQLNGCIFDLEGVEYSVDRQTEELMQDIAAALKDMDAGVILDHNRLNSFAWRLGLNSKQEALKQVSLLEQLKELAEEEGLINRLMDLATQINDGLVVEKQQERAIAGMPIMTDVRCSLSPYERHMSGELEEQNTYYEQDSPVRPPMDKISNGVVFEKKQEEAKVGIPILTDARCSLSSYERHMSGELEEQNTSYEQDSPVRPPIGKISDGVVVEKKQEEAKARIPILTDDWCSLSSYERHMSGELEEQNTSDEQDSPVRPPINKISDGVVVEKEQEEAKVGIPILTDAQCSLSSYKRHMSDELEEQNTSYEQDSPVRPPIDKIIDVVVVEKKQEEAKVGIPILTDVRCSLSSDERHMSSEPEEQNTSYEQDSSVRPPIDKISDGIVVEKKEAEDKAGIPIMMDAQCSFSPYKRHMSGELEGRSASSEQDSLVARPSTNRSSVVRNQKIASSMDVSISGIRTEVKRLVEGLLSESASVQRGAASDIRLLAKNSSENRILIATCGAIKPLVRLLSSRDPVTQENAVTALLNLSINDNNKREIAGAAGAIEFLVEALKVGTTPSRENAAAALFSLSVVDESKAAIGRSGAIPPLVDLLVNGTGRGKKDAATALFNLSILNENKGSIIEAGAVKPLVGLMTEPAAGMVDKAVAVLANLAATHEGRASIRDEGGIPALVEVVEMGSLKGKADAAAALLHLCLNSSRCRRLVWQEGAIPPLVMLSKSGTSRAKEKASALLRLFRERLHHGQIRTGANRSKDHPY